MRRLFGTDGVRGLANGEVLTPELSLSLAASAARVLAERDRSHRPVAVVGRDPRASGEMLEAAVVAGLASAGADAVRVGVLPTPAVAHLVDALRRRPGRDDLGVAQRHAGQRHQALRGGRPQAAGRRRARRRGGARRAVHPAHRRPDRPRARSVRRRRAAVRRRTCWRAPRSRCPGCVWSSTARYGAASAAAPDCYARAGAEVIALHAEPGRAQHQRRRRLDPPRAAARGGTGARRGPGHRPRRRRRPLPGRRRGRRATSTATRSWRCWPSRCRRPASSSTTRWSPPS